VTAPGRLISSSALRTRLRFAHWTLVTRAPGNRDFLVKFIDGPCDPLAAVAVQNRTAGVAVIPVLGTGNDPCAATLEQAHVLVELTQALAHGHQLLDPKP